MDIKFRFFRVNQYMNLWKYIKEIRELQKNGVLIEECPLPNYWEFRVVKFEKIPKYIKDEIISSERYLL